MCAGVEWMKYIVAMSLLGAWLLAPNALFADEPRTGRFQAKFDERHPVSDIREIAKKVALEGVSALPKNAQEITIGDETFEVYVPPTYSHDVPHGLMVWISPGDDGGPHPPWHPVLDEHALIWVGANNSGNDRNWLVRRLPLAFDALHNMRKRYHIDPNRLYIAGHSGGGRCASRIALHYPDLFSGALYVNGMDNWVRVGKPGATGKSWGASFPSPSSKDMRMARNRGRYVLMTGDDDFNREQTKAYYDALYEKELKEVLYLQVTGGGHDVPSAAWFAQAIEFLDTNISDDSRKITAELNPGPPFIPPNAVMVPGADFPVRTWTSVTGNTVDAALVRLDRNFVILLTADRATLDIQMDALSDKDKAYVQSMLPRL